MNFLGKKNFQKDCFFQNVFFSEAFIGPIAMLSTFIFLREQFANNFEKKNLCFKDVKIWIKNRLFWAIFQKIFFSKMGLSVFGVENRQIISKVFSFLKISSNF